MMEIITIPMGELTPDPNNAKDHPRWQVDQIKSSRMARLFGGYRIGKKRSSSR